MIVNDRSEADSDDFWSVLAHVSGGDIELTSLGRAYVDDDMLARKQPFAEALLKHVPLAARITRVLDERPDHRAPPTARP